MNASLFPESALAAPAAHVGSFTAPEPGAIVYLAYCAQTILRYFLVMGGAYWLTHVYRRHVWARKRIQRAFPPAGTITYEIRWSLLTLLATGLSTMLLFTLVRSDRTSLYFTLDAYPPLYLPASILLAIAGYETWNYWQHRMLHTDWFFRHVHHVHHHIDNPTPFASFCRHPLEAWMEHAYFILFMVFVPIHPVAMVAVALWFFLFGIVGHLGYELFPRGFTRHRLLGWLNTATHHNMHHSHQDCHYGNWSNFWDWAMDTNHAEYHRTFDAIHVGGR
jgi:sterol desaturase/sphingolipid hydroxylase (fatty acid hydroxylase superfamily)